MQSETPKSILLDDDSLVRDLWTYVYKMKKKPLICYSNVDDFLNALPSLSRVDFFYIDQDLNHALTGAEIARDLIKNGYANVYLASGHEPEDLPVIEGLKGFVGKNPVD